MKTTDYAALVALDWGDEEHAFALGAGEDTETGHIVGSAEALHDWLHQLGERFAAQPIALAIEAGRSAVMHALVDYPWLTIYPVHPATSERFRKAFVPSGAKDDLPDAVVLLRILAQNREQLRALRLDTAATRELAALRALYRAAQSVCGGWRRCGGVPVGVGGEWPGESVGAEAGVERVGVSHAGGALARVGRNEVHASIPEATAADGADDGRVSCAFCAVGGHAEADGGARVWSGIAADGVAAAAGASRGLRARPVAGARRQGGSRKRFRRRDRFRRRLRRPGSVLNESMYYVYVLQSQRDDGLYIGYSSDLRRRLAQHQAGESFATSFRGPWRLIYYEAYLEEPDARGREEFLKSGLGRRLLAKQCRHHFAKQPKRSRRETG